MLLSGNSSEQQKVKNIMQQTEYSFSLHNCFTFSSESTHRSKDLWEPGRERASECVHVCVSMFTWRGIERRKALRCLWQEEKLNLAWRTEQDSCSMSMLRSFTPVTAQSKKHFLSPLTTCWPTAPPRAHTLSLNLVYLKIQPWSPPSLSHTTNATDILQYFGLCSPKVLAHF